MGLLREAAKMPRCLPDVLEIQNSRNQNTNIVASRYDIDWKSSRCPQKSC